MCFKFCAFVVDERKWISAYTGILLLVLDFDIMLCKYPISYIFCVCWINAVIDNDLMFDLLAPRYIVGKSEMEASKEGKILRDFKYGCVGYSIYADQKNRTPDAQQSEPELPICMGLEVSVIDWSSSCLSCFNLAFCEVINLGIICCIFIQEEIVHCGNLFLPLWHCAIRFCICSVQFTIIIARADWWNRDIVLVLRIVI